MADPIDFYFDFSSPYAYFAAQKIDDIAMEFGGREVEWRPFLLGVAMKTTNNIPLAHQPLKGDYCIDDWARLARFMGVPWTLSSNFPIATLAAARAYYWIKDKDKAQAKEFARQCLAVYFGEGRDISDVETIADVATRIGIDADAFRYAITDNTVKDRLKNETQAAVEAGVFGSPFFIVDGEKFWGSDRLWMIKRWLKTGGW